MPKFINRFFLVVVAGFFCLPAAINFNPGTYPGAFNFFQIFIPLVLIILGLILFILNSHKTITINYFSLLLLAIVIFLCLQFALNHPAYTAVYLVPVCILISAAVLSILITNLQLEISQIIYAAAIGILINNYNQIIQSVFQIIHYKFYTALTIYDIKGSSRIWLDWFALQNGRINGATGQANLLADLLSWGILANIIVFNNKKLPVRLIHIFNLIIFSIFIALTESRAAYFYPIALIIYALILWRKDKSSGLIIHKLLISSNVLILILIVYYGWQHLLITNNSPHNTIIDTIIPATYDRAGSVLQRFTMWGKAWNMFLTHPLLGVGWNQFSQHYLSTPLPYFVKLFHGELTAYGNCHNLILQLLATTGIIGTFLVLGTIIYVIRRLAYLPTQWQILPCGVIFIVLTHSMFEYPLYTPTIFFPIVMLASCGIYPKTKAYHQINLAKGIAVLIAALGAIGLYSSLHNYLILAKLTKPAYYRPQDPITTELYKDQALSLSPFWDDYADYNLVANIAFDEKMSGNSTYFELFKHTLTQVANFQPHPMFLIKLAVMQTIDGEDGLAKANLNLAFANYPKFKDKFIVYLKQITARNQPLQAKLLAMINQ